MISFNVPPYTGCELKYVEQAVKNQKICGDGEFTRLCNQWIEDHTQTCKALLTTSCTHALEMAALLVGTCDGDEVIMPSYTFVSTANAFVLRGAKIKYVDIRPDTMNINEDLIEEAITDKTKAIVPVHYAGVSCDMDKIMSLANKYNISVIEDAAQGVMSAYKGKALGSIGHLGCYSFHETKNYSMGEGGALLVNKPDKVEEAEIIREKGTDRSRFYRGQVDKYTWIDMGSSYLPSELNAAYLWGQLQNADIINENRLNSWKIYYDGLTELKESGCIDLPVVPVECKHNAHMFYIKTKDISERTRLIDYLKKNDILAVFHYVPLHSSPAGRYYGEFVGEDRFTTVESERLLRLPLYYGLKEEEIEKIINVISEFYSEGYYKG